MNESLKKVERILQEIRESSDSISGGSSKEGSFIMRKPNLYWDLGIAVQKFCDENDIPVNERIGWVTEYFSDKDEAIWPGHQLSKYGYKYVYEFVDKENYLLVANLAGHIFQNFRKKRVDYLVTSFSKRKPQLNPEKQKLLIKRLSEKNYSHDDFLKVLREVRGKTQLPSEKTFERFEEFMTEVQTLMNSSPQEREKFRSEIGLKLLDQIRFTLQLLRMRDPIKFKLAFGRVKVDLAKNSPSKSEIAVNLFNLLRDCLGDDKKTNSLFDVIDSSEMSLLNTLLNALKSEVNYKDYNAKREALKKIFSD